MERDPTSQLMADNLSRLLVERKVSALQLASMCGLGRSTVYDIVAGRSQSAKVQTVAKLARALGVPITELLLTPDQLAAQTEMLRSYYLLPLEEQQRLARVVRAWRPD